MYWHFCPSYCLLFIRGLRVAQLSRMQPVQKEAEAPTSRAESKEQSRHQKDKTGLMKKLKLEVTVVSFLRNNETISDEKIQQLHQLVEREKVLRPKEQDSCLPKKLHTKLL